MAAVPVGQPSAVTHPAPQPLPVHLLDGPTAEPPGAWPGPAGSLPSTALPGCTPVAARSGSAAGQGTAPRPAPSPAPRPSASLIEFRHHSLQASTIVSWSLPVAVAVSKSSDRDRNSTPRPVQALDHLQPVGQPPGEPVNVGDHQGVPLDHQVQQFQLMANRVLAACRAAQPLEGLPGRSPQVCLATMSQWCHRPWCWTAAMSAPAATTRRAMPMRPLCPEKPSPRPAALAAARTRLARASPVSPNTEPSERGCSAPSG